MGGASAQVTFMPDSHWHKHSAGSSKQRVRLKLPGEWENQLVRATYQHQILHVSASSTCTYQPQLQSALLAAFVARPAKVAKGGVAVSPVQSWWFILAQPAVTTLLLQDSNTCRCSFLLGLLCVISCQQASTIPCGPTATWVMALTLYNQRWTTWSSSWHSQATHHKHPRLRQGHHLHTTMHHQVQFRTQQQEG